MLIKEAYIPKLIAATGVVFAGQGAIGGFLASTSGTLQLRETSGAGAIVVASMPVTAGIFHAMPFAFANGLYAELGGGATGTFGLT